MAEKILGNVKWFSNKKGYGFITPVEGSTVTNDIFVHQSAIHSDGYRTLDEEWLVEFEIGVDEDGKPKAENVTAPGGGPCTGPRKQRNPHRRRRRERKHEGDDENNVDHGGENGHTGDDNMAGEKKQPHRGRERREREPQPMWHDILSEEVKQALKDKGIRTSTGTIDISCGKSRIKLGTRGYASLADEDGILAEGSFECDADGHATFEWKRAIQFTDVWNTFLNLASIVNEISLSDESVKAVEPHETMFTLIGESTPDPRTTLAASGFEMRRVVLTTKRRSFE